MAEWLGALNVTIFRDGEKPTLWGWPLALTVHAFGTALVVGFFIIISLRLLGLFGTIPYATINRLFPVIWIALVIQFISGFVLWTDKADAICRRWRVRLASSR